MLSKKGMTLVDIVVTMMIVGVLVTIAVPNFGKSMVNTKVQGVENNLRAMGVAEQKYNEDHGAYYASPNALTPYAGVNDASSITSNLSLTLGMVNDGFNYTCANTGTCTANNPTIVTAGLINTVAVDLNGNITCSNSGTSITCP